MRVATTYIHHNHNSQTLDNDIALLKLHGQAELKDGVCLVCLPARGVSHAAGKRCTVTGYGYMGEGKIQLLTLSFLYFIWNSIYLATLYYDMNVSLTLHNKCKHLYVYASWTNTITRTRSRNSNRQ